MTGEEVHGELPDVAENSAIWRGGERPDTGLAGVGVAPGVDFGQAGKRAVRFSYASSEENIREAATRLAEYLKRRG